MQNTLLADVGQLGDCGQHEQPPCKPKNPSGGRCRGVSKNVRQPGKQHKFRSEDCPCDKPATLHHRCKESNGHGQEVWPLRVVQEHVEKGDFPGEDEYPTWRPSEENKGCRTCCKQCKSYSSKLSVVRLILPPDECSAYLVCADYQVH